MAPAMIAPVANAPGSENTRPQRDGLAVALLAACTLLLLSPFLFTWPTPLIYPASSLGTDLSREAWPVAYLVKQSILQTGELPLWRTYLLSGAPLLGHPVYPLFYPPHWLILLLPIPLAFNIDLAIHLFWMGLGVYFYLRKETSTRWEAALAGALIFSQSPMWIAHIGGGHISMIAAIAWFPWILFAASRYWKTAKIRWAVVAGIGLAAQFMNHVNFLALSLLVVSTASMVIFLLHKRKAVARLIVGWLAATSIAVLLSAVQLLPFLELIGQSSRSAISIEDASFGSLPPPLLLGIFFPSNLKFPEWFIYPGIGALALAVFGKTTGWSGKERVAAIAVLIGAVLSLGSHTFLYSPMSSLIPGYSLLRVSARWWILSLFGLSLLAAWGLEKWLTQPVSRTIRATNPMVLLALFYTIAIVFWAILRGSLPFSIMPQAAGMLILLWILALSKFRPRVFPVLILLLADLWWTAGGLIRPQSESGIAASNPAISLLQTAAKNGDRSFAPYGGLDMSQLAKFNLRAADGYDSFILNSYARLGQYASGCEDNRYAVSVPSTASNPAAVKVCPDSKPRMPLLALLNVRYLLLPAGNPIPGLRFLMAQNGLRVYELPSGVGRAFGVIQGIPVATGECLETLGRIDPFRQVVLEQELPFPSTGTPPVVLSRVEETNREIFQVDAANPGMLVRSESWAPGWKVLIDGKPARLYRADCALQGVWLENGFHEVTFQYTPDGFLVGSWISLGVGILLLLLSIPLLLPPRASKHPAQVGSPRKS
jgi:hypothetical protein